MQVPAPGPNTDHSGQQWKSRSSSKAEVDDDRPVNGDETSLGSPDVAEFTGVHPEYLRILG